MYSPPHYLCLSARALIFGRLLSAFKSPSSYLGHISSVFIPAAVLPFLSPIQESRESGDRRKSCKALLCHFLQMRLFGDPRCPFVSDPVCVCLSPARCAGNDPGKRLKHQIQFPMIHYWYYNDISFDGFFHLNKIFSLQSHQGALSFLAPGVVKTFENHFTFNDSVAGKKKKEYLWQISKRFWSKLSVWRENQIISLSKDGNFQWMDLSKMFPVDRNYSFSSRTSHVFCFLEFMFWLINIHASSNINVYYLT